MKHLHTLLLLASGTMSGQLLELTPPAAGKINFEQHVQPILESKCYSCHGPTKQLAGLRLDKRQNALRGGDYGKVIVPGDSEVSTLIHRVSGSKAGMQMPPAGPLEADEIAILRAWIDQGPDYGNSQLSARSVVRNPVSPAMTALVNAVVADDTPAIRAALGSDKAMAAAVDAGGSTALMHAAGRGTVAAMEILLQAGAPVDARNARGAAALTWALADPAKVKLLLDHGASVNYKTGEGKSPLHIAAQQSGIPQTFTMLMAKGADVLAADATGATPLHAAATAGSEPFVRALLAAGAKIDAPTMNGATPLILAATSGANSVVRLLLDSGADATRVTKKRIGALASASYWGDTETMRQLIAKGASVQLADDEGWTPLRHAAYSEVASVEAVRLLLRQGAKPDPATVALAARRGAADVVRILQGSDEQALLRSAVTKAFGPLESQSANFVRIGGCNSCHSQDLPLFAQRVARDRGIAAGGEIALAPEPQDFERVFEHSGLLSAGSIGYNVMGLTARNQPANAKTDAMVNYLRAHQEADGRWVARSNRQPLSTGDHHSTAFAIYVLKSYGRQPAVAQSMSRAVAWLQEHAPVSNQDAAMQLFGMVWGGADQDVVAKAAAGLMVRQREEGGWAQLPSLRSDAYATGQALYALALAGISTSAPAYRKGIEYLLRTQAPDGTWHVQARSKPFQPYFESGFPYGHDQWISAAGTSWAAMALAMAVEPPTASAKR